MAGTTKRTRHVPPSPLTQRPHSGPALVPRFGPEFPRIRELLHIHLPVCLAAYNSDRSISRSQKLCPVLTPLTTVAPLSVGVFPSLSLTLSLSFLPSPLLDPAGADARSRVESLTADARILSPLLNEPPSHHRAHACPPAPPSARNPPRLSGLQGLGCRCQGAVCCAC
jgi:hypothetical protein